MAHPVPRSRRRAHLRRGKGTVGLLVGLFLAIAIWAVLLSLGIVLNRDGDWGRAGVVLAVFGLFLGLWLLAWVMRRRRMQ